MSPLRKLRAGSERALKTPHGRDASQRARRVSRQVHAERAAQHDNYAAAKRAREDAGFELSIEIQP